MLWIFVIFGMLIFIAAATGFWVTVRGSMVRSSLHFVALFLIGTAWVNGHERAAGWLALLGGAGIEGILWMLVIWQAVTPKPNTLASAEEAPQIADTVSTSPEPTPVPASADPPEVQTMTPEPTADPTEPRMEMPRPAALMPPTEHEPPPSDEAHLSTPAPPPHLATYQTFALLKSRWQLTADVFLASLRRGGQRDARISEHGAAGIPISIDIAGVALELECQSSPVNRDLLDYALSQTFDWPEATSAVTDHQGHIALKTRAPEDVTRRDILRLHCRAHVALAEFAPLVAVLFPDAGRLLAPSAMLTLEQGAPDPTATCIAFRTFSLDGRETGMTLCDTTGLHAFDLPDLQLIVEGEPDEGVSRVLYRMAEQFFENGCPQADGEELQSPSSEKWIAQWGQSRFAPFRRVIELRRVV